MNAFLTISLSVLALIAGFLVIALLLWWLLPLAFPALSFGFGNALALSAITLLVTGLASAK